MYVSVRVFVVYHGIKIVYDCGWVNYEGGNRMCVHVCVSRVGLCGCVCVCVCPSKWCVGGETCCTVTVDSFITITFWAYTNTLH